MIKNFALTAKLLLVAAAAAAAVSCSPVPGPDKSLAGAVLGAGWGAGAGAVIGHQTGGLEPGAAIGAAFGAGAGLLTGIGLDTAESGELDQQREIDALKVQVASNQQALYGLQSHLDDRDRRLSPMAYADQIFFDSDRASLRAGSAFELERLAEAIKTDPYIGRVELHGHSDDTGNTERNMRLSEARARTVATFLSQHGVSWDNLRLVPHGAELPLASNDTDSGKQLNRRVEIVVRK